MAFKVCAPCFAVAVSQSSGSVRIFQNGTVMLQIERLEARFAKLGMLHNRDFSAREREIREGLKSAGFAESYRTYLSIRGKAGEDPLLAEVRKRAGL